MEKSGGVLVIRWRLVVCVCYKQEKCRQKEGQVRTCRVRSDPVRSVGQVRSGQVRSGQVGSGQVSSGQVMWLTYSVGRPSELSYDC